jgi:putative ATP-dependent endonuclease of the OLD family
MISRVRIQNFRSIEDQEICFENLTALVGHNSSGKSNILKAISTCLGKEWPRINDFSTEDFLDYDTTKDVTIEIDFDPPLRYVAFKWADPVDVPRFRFLLTRYKKDTADHKAGELRLESRPLDSEGEPIMALAQAPKKGKSHQYKPLTSIPRELKRQVPLIYVDTDRSLSQQMPSARYSLLRRLLEDVADEIDHSEMAVGGELVSRKTEFEQRLQAVIDVLRVPGFVDLENAIRKEAIQNLGIRQEESEMFRLEFGLFSPMDFFRAMEIWIQERGRRFLASSLGLGAQNAIVLAIFQAYERFKKRGAVFLIEEPEMFLHPQQSRAFYDTLRNISENNQVIYTTHSSHFTSVPSFNEIRRVAKDISQRTTVVQSSLPDIDQIRHRLFQQLTQDRSELFFADHVVLVEGQTERTAFPEWARRMGVDVNRRNISIIEVGGKKSLTLFLDVVSSLQIPVTVVFDTDSSDFGGNREKELDFNRTLIERAGEGIRVIEMEPDYENAYRQQIGEESYLKLCNRYPGPSKSVRAVQIARDESATVPEICRQVFSLWIEVADTDKDGGALDL